MKKLIYSCFGFELTYFFLCTDDPHSKVFGSVTDGVFEGKIIAHDGAYYVEHARRYFPPNGTRTRIHSVIYRDGDVSDPYAHRRHGENCFCPYSEFERS